MESETGVSEIQHQACRNFPCGLPFNPEQILILTIDVAKFCRQSYISIDEEHSSVKCLIGLVLLEILYYFDRKFTDA